MAATTASSPTALSINPILVTLTMAQTTSPNVTNTMSWAASTGVFGTMLAVKMPSSIPLKVLLS